jgi:hypothetical protein
MLLDTVEKAQKVLDKPSDHIILMAGGSLQQLVMSPTHVLGRARNSHSVSQQIPFMNLIHKITVQILSLVKAYLDPIALKVTRSIPVYRVR